MSIDNVMSSEADYDEFIDKPSVSVRRKRKFTDPKNVGSSNVCVYLHIDSNELKPNEIILLTSLVNLCSYLNKQRSAYRTATHNIALFIKLQIHDSTILLGFCTELAARVLVKRACLLSELPHTIYRDYMLESQHEIDEEEFKKIPFNL